MRLLLAALHQPSDLRQLQRQRPGSAGGTGRRRLAIGWLAGVARRVQAAGLPGLLSAALAAVAVAHALGIFSFFFLLSEGGVLGASFLSSSCSAEVGV